LNVGVLDNLNGTSSELLEYLNADTQEAGGAGLAPMSSSDGRARALTQIAMDGRLAALALLR
jgi:hypothetical protein